MNTAERNSNTNWSCRLKLSNVAASADTTDLWTFKKQTNGTYWVQDSNGKYLTVGSGSADVQSSSANLTIGTCAGSDYSGWDIAQNSYYLNQYGGDAADYAAGYSNTYASGAYDQGSCWNIYRITSGDATKSTLTFTGVVATPEGQYATVTIGDTTYYITVTAEEVDDTDTLPIQLWITSQTIQLTQAKDGYTTSSTTGNFGNGGSAQYLLLKPTDAYGTQGKALSECLPLYVEQHYEYGGTWYANEQTGKQPFDFMLWKGTVLNQDTGFQVIWGDSMINAGTDFRYIRYLGGKWEVSADRVNWTQQVKGTGSTTNASSCTEQIVAYYYMRTELTDEVTTNVVDWGDPYESNTYGYFALLDFAVMPESGSRMPDASAFPIKNRTLAYHCNDRTNQTADKYPVLETAAGNKYRRIDQIEATNVADYEIYMITLTPTSDTPTERLVTDGKYSSTIGESSDIYKGTEKVVWVKSVEDLNQTPFASEDLWYSSPSGETVFRTDDTTEQYVGGKAELSSVEIYRNQGLLVTYYVRTKAEKVLTVHYCKEDGTQFYEITIAVGENTYFDDKFGMGDEKNTLVNNTVKNVKNNDETVQADLKQLPLIPAEYRRVTYTLVRTSLDPTTKAMDAYLYYTFDSNATFIADFGLPMTITPTQVNTNLKNATITNAKATVSSDTPLTVDTTNPNAIVITPTKDFAAAKSGVSFTLEYTGTKAGETTQATVGYRITIIPASNVLYEENFLSNTDGTWTQASVDHSAVQETQKANDEEGSYNVFGYDSTYAESKSENGVWKAANLSSAARTGALTADFYGNGFDLIGNCGETTGRVMLIIAKQGSKQGLKAAIVDTRYKTDIYQVPLAHLELSTEGAYTAYIYASGLDAVTASTQAAVYSAPALMSVNAADPVADVLAEYGLSSADVEYIGGDQIAASPIAVQRAPAIAAYADSTIERQAGDHVEIAGFRVYRSTAGTVAANYPAAEQNLTYTNIIDFMAGQTVTANVESGTVTDCAIEGYEGKGGPQNEVYLSGGQFVIFATEAKAGDKLQVSLRAVNGPTAYNQKTISSVTEMYYEIDAMQTQDGSYVFAIANTDDNLLGIGNVKLPTAAGEITTVDALSDETILSCARAVFTAAPEPVEPELFTPDTFKVHVTSLPMFRSKIVTLGITVSKDVAYVTVNGRTYTPSQFFSRWLKTVTIPVTETISRSETRTYTIIAYNSDGTASEPIVVKG